MSSRPDYDSRTHKAKKTTAQSPTNPLAGQSGPTTFLFKTEKQLERSAQRGRRTSRSSGLAEDPEQKQLMASETADSSFGVESLEEAINATLSSESSLSRTNSNTIPSDGGTETGDLRVRKRKAGNPVHPKIAATGQRILSSERLPRPPSSGASPVSYRSSESPYKTNRLRRGSTSSLANFSQPGTPIKLSPQPESVLSSTPRSASPRSFRLSDEEASAADETGSQAILSSNGEEEEAGGEGPPQLVMPSLAMPSRRPFTERGKQIGRAKIMIAGPKGAGKTSLVNSIIRSSEHIVYVDETPEIAPNEGDNYCKHIYASTRPYPSWWTDFENRRMLHRMKSVGRGALERNLVFIDTPGLESDDSIHSLLELVQAALRRTARMGHMSDSELVGVLSGEGGAQIDVILYLFEPALAADDGQDFCGLSKAHQELLRFLCKWTNFVPLIGKADGVAPEALAARKQQVSQLLNDLKARPYRLADADGDSGRACPDQSPCLDSNCELSGTSPLQPHDSPPFPSPVEPFAVSSAAGDDADVIDASVLMSSQYMQPLTPSELDFAVDVLLSPSNTAKMRHFSAAKLLLWRQSNLGSLFDAPPQMLIHSPELECHSPGVASTGSFLEDSSKVLVPHRAAGRSHSMSPSGSCPSILSGAEDGNCALTRLEEHSQPTEPFRQVRLAKWAQDLQRGLFNERQKYMQMYHPRPSGWTSDNGSGDDHAERALVVGKDAAQPRPPRGRLGGELAVIDPRDPLGVLAFGQALSRRGFLALQIAGGCGLVGTLAYWVVKHWVDVQCLLGFGPPMAMVHVAAVPAPKAWHEEIPDGLRSLLGWER